jgi:two-component system, OmpR family, sensor histidine kinase ChvG
VLERTPQPQSDTSAPFRRGLERRLGGRMVKFRLLLRRMLRPFASSLVRRILFLNLLGLAALLLGFLWINQTRISVIDARAESLRVQAEIIAAALAGAVQVDGLQLTIDPEKLLELQVGQILAEDPGNALEFSLNPERVAPILQRLVTPARLRARVYDRDGLLLFDTQNLLQSGLVEASPLPGAAKDQTLFQRSWSSWKRRLGRMELTRLDESMTGDLTSEVRRVLTGTSVSVVRVNAKGDTIVSHGLPIRRQRLVQGALHLATQDGDIDEVIADERLAILQLFAGVTAVMAMLSMLMANAIAKPVERLARGAERVRRSIKSRHQLPDLSARHDEIGHLSGALTDMTNALYTRIEAIERFAADVSHELKNPLTSLRSAIETLPRIKDEAARDRLMGVIQHDVRRLDRLISDISDASRLDAELARSDAAPVDVSELLGAVISMQNDLRKAGQPDVVLSVLPYQPPVRRKGDAGKDKKPLPTRFVVHGHDSRLAQVMANLIDNARSFSPADAKVTITLSRDMDHVLIAVEDHGPGVPEIARERIFERFYTDRPADHGFGQNSGLGLSISRQIIEAHRGTITVTDRADGLSGARFEVRMPLLSDAGELRG